MVIDEIRGENGSLFEITQLQKMKNRNLYLRRNVDITTVISNSSIIFKNKKEYGEEI